MGKEEMTTHTFAPWVQPIAAGFQRERGAVSEFARGAEPAFWEQASDLEGWTCKDLLSHLAAGTNKQVQAILRAVVAKARLDPGIFGDSGAVNARDIEARRGWTVDAVIAEYDADTEEIVGLLAQLQESDGDLRQKDFTMSLAEALAIFPSHDREHFDQLRAASEASR
jgi:uncharacterized protein (TIGR03083 family)